jgi:putative transposase
MLVEKISDFRWISTRKIQEIVGHLGIDQLFPASVSRMAKDLDDQVQVFLLRPIE